MCEFCHQMMSYEPEELKTSFKITKHQDPKIQYFTSQIKREGDETMGKTKVCPRPEKNPHFDSRIFCDVKAVFRFKIE